MDELSLPECARRTGLDYQWLHHHVTAGDIPARQLPNARWRVPVAALPAALALREELRTYPHDGPRPDCSVDGCDLPFRAAGLCHNHRDQAWKRARRLRAERAGL